MANSSIPIPGEIHESPCIKAGLHLKLPKFEHIFLAVITFPPLSSVQILLIPACCLVCLL